VLSRPPRPAPQPAPQPAYDREAAQVRADVRLIDGAAAAAPAIVRRQEAREELETAAQRAAASIVRSEPARPAAPAPQARPAPAYDREAAQVRADIRLLEGAAAAAREIVRREDAKAATERAARLAAAERARQDQAARQRAVSDWQNNASRAPGRVANAAATVAAPVARAAMRSLGGALSAVTGLVTGFGRYAEQQTTPQEPAMSRRSPEPTAAQRARQYLNSQSLERPDIHTRQLAAAYSGSVSAELQAKLRRLAEEEHRKGLGRPGHGRER